MRTDSPHPLRAWREKNGLTLAGLSKRLGKPTIPVSTLAYYELGQRIPVHANMGRLRRLTGVTADQFYDFRQVAA